jgi:ribosomal-protein-alanine N-acetyltransferase
VCRVDNKIVAICLVGNLDDGCYIISLGVVKEYRRYNIGNNLLTLASKKAKYLHVEITNDPAIHLYRKHQFSCKYLIKNYYGSDRHAFLMYRL